MKSLRFEIEGIAATIMHNGQLADPLNEWSKALKALSSKRNKTDDDREEMGRIEFMGGLYLTSGDNPVPCWPASNIHAMIRSAAKRTKRGNDVLNSVFVLADAPLIYDGPTDPDELHETPGFRDYRGCGVNNATIYRTRPIFPEWSLVFDVDYNPETVDRADLESWIAAAGQFVGLSDYRPQFGRFVVKSVVEIT